MKKPQNFNKIIDSLDLFKRIRNVKQDGDGVKELENDSTSLEESSQGDEGHSSIGWHPNSFLFPLSNAEKNNSSSSRRLFTLESTTVKDC